MLWGGRRRTLSPVVCVAAVMSGAFAMFVTGQTRPRARDLGIAPGTIEPGPLNAITDVEPVRVLEVGRDGVDLALDPVAGSAWLSTTIGFASASLRS